ncbi:MAG: serine/threonine-protein kinase [Planctomycetota bacterium]|nr:serine/threonine-protein kinase [Planctomycetota bacterium]
MDGDLRGWGEALERTLTGVVADRCHLLTGTVETCKSLVGGAIVQPTRHLEGGVMDGKPGSVPHDSEIELRVYAIAEEFFDHLQAGETPQEEALLSANPEITDLLERQLALVRMLHWTRSYASREDTGAPESGPEALFVREPGDLPDQVGSYSILKALGSGGMGEVYLAEQVEPVQRQVALKIIKLGMDTKEVVARFNAERRALALMNHPNIARVYEAGAAEGGRPYFVMEYVPGVPLTQHCDKARLTTAERLRLFLKVCDAVQHAHYKGVIHRDLKPSNILIMLQDGLPVPKIIDFGIAKATHQRLAERTFSTEEGRMIGTPEYMSPEQAGTDSLDADTRTDIYSLGVILYELLVGALPFDPRELRQLHYEEIRRRIREDEPLKPSRRLSTHGDEAMAVARLRRSDPRALARLLNSDLDWVVLRAMEKDRSRRYSTAAELSADLQRYLRNEPVQARPPSAGYRLRKYIRRHRVAVMGVLSVGLALLVGLFVSTALYVRADAEWKRAEEASHSESRQRRAAQAAEAEAQLARIKTEKSADRANAIGEFLHDMLSSPDPAKDGKDVKVVEILDRAAKKVGTKMGHDPEVEAALRGTMGEAYRSLGKYAKAERQLRAQLEICLRVSGGENLQSLRSMNSLARVLADRGKYSEAEPLYRRALDTQSRVLRKDHPDTLASKNNLAALLLTQGRHSEAEGHFRYVLESQRRLLGEGHRDTLYSMNNLGSLLRARGEYPEAERLQRAVLEVSLNSPDDKPDDIPILMNNLAETMSAQGRFSEAEPLLRRVLKIQRNLLGAGHPMTLRSRSNLAAVLAAQGKNKEAERSFREILEESSRVLGKEHPSTIGVTFQLARVLHAQDKLEDAERLYRSSLDACHRVLGKGHQGTLISMCGLGALLKVQGKISEAEPLLRGALAGYRRLLGEEHPETLASTTYYASLLHEMGNVDESETLIRRALDQNRGLLGDEHLLVLRAELVLAKILGTQGNLERAESLLRRILEAQLTLLGEEHSHTLTTMGNLVTALIDQGRLAEAEKLGRRSVEIARKALPEGVMRTAVLQITYGRCLTDLKRYYEAEEQLLNGYRDFLALMGDDHPGTREFLQDLIDLYAAWGKPEKAKEYRKHLRPNENASRSQ